MMRTLLVLCGIIISQSLAFYQTDIHDLHVYSITEFEDGFVITTLDKLNSDTLRIVSMRDPSIVSNNKYQKIEVGKRYRFELDKIAENMAAVPSGSLTVRIKTTVVWTSRDGIKKMPVYAKNVKDRFLIE